jgi:hypothetical protein
MKRTCLSLITAAFVAAAASPAPAADDGGPLDLKFPGGTVAEYVEALRAATGANVVVWPEAEGVPVHPMQLSRVTLADAVFLLDGLERGFEHRHVRLDVDFLGQPDQEEARPIFQIRAQVRSPRGPTEVFTRVWSLSGILGNRSADDVLTAVETSIELAGDLDPAASIRYHGETMLLIARGGPGQISAIESVIDALVDADERRMHREDTERATTEVRRELDMLQQRLDQAAAALAQATKERTEWQTRAQLYAQEMDTLRGRLDEAEHLIQRQQAMIDELKRSEGGR